jgi:MFS family permease
MNQQFRTYIIFWLSQSVSQFGSAMTGFALVLWAYQQTNSAMAVSLMTFCTYLPYILVSLFAGAFIEHHKKKNIMLFADLLAAICSFFVLITWNLGSLQMLHIYAVNVILGFMNAFQSPAVSVAIGKMVPSDKLSQASGMDSFSSNLITVIAPVVASAIFAFGGLGTVILFDLASFLFAFLILLLLIKIPETIDRSNKASSALEGCKEGFRFLQKHKGLWFIILTMAVINFFSRLTYENILSPMILARSGGSSSSLGLVNAFLGIGGILGGIIVSTGKISKHPVKMIYIPAFISFLAGDLLMGIGQNNVLWCIAGLAASIPIPFIMAGQRVILYQTVPKDMQGRVFSLRNAIQFSTIPVGILLGGFLADYVFEPFMKSEVWLAKGLSLVVGSGAGSGMAVMFLGTGILGSLASLVAYKGKEVRKLRKD